MDSTIRPARFEDIPHMSDLFNDLFSLESDFEPDPEKRLAVLNF